MRSPEGYAARPAGFFLILSPLLFLLLLGCSGDPEPAAEEESVALSAGCRSCHEVELDEHHQLACTACHGGNDQATGLAQAHRKLVPRPAHPAHAQSTCGNCHEQEVEMVADNHHYTLAGHLSSIREVFGGAGDIDSPLQLVSFSEPENELELVDDLLRRRCLRCHVYYQGDNFPGVRRGLGCAACHLEAGQVAAGSHRFLEKPGDSICLTCHYGNHVGFDFHGRYEHDFNQEYRTPYLAPENIVAPYGVEYHQLETDVHQRAGMICIDCHGQAQVMGRDTGPRCERCHDPNWLKVSTNPAINSDGEAYRFVSPTTARDLPLPTLRHPAHETYHTRATCQACHARWTFNDGTTHLLRIDHDDFYDFFRLSVDGSSEVKHIIDSHIDIDGDWLDPFMTDKFTTRPAVGIWLKGFLERRWEEPLFTRDEKGRIAPARPLLDLRLSWVDVNEQVRFDNVKPLPGYSLVRPYVPHTTGAAGLFFEERLRLFEIRELALEPDETP